ncbi:hypothetical protein FHG87_012471 [Trinorchestia longiramus]|nr:hypothetical protein FHG87_012471 [Trinorchestia longiramus]
MMLEIVDGYSKDFKVKFGGDKSKVMVINWDETDRDGEWNIGEVKISRTKEYKYLGCMLSEDGCARTIENGVERPVPIEILHLLDSILSLESPDDLQVHALAAQIRNITNAADYRWLCSHICSGGSSSRQAASVVAVVCRETASHAVGAIKMRSLLFRTAQALYDEHEHVSRTDHEKFVTGTLFLGELFYYVKSESGSPFAVLAEPLVTMLNKILQKHLKEPPTRRDLSDLNSQHSCKKSTPKTVENHVTRLLEPEQSCPDAVEEAGALEEGDEETESQINGDGEGEKSDCFDSNKGSSNTKDELPKPTDSTEAAADNVEDVQNSLDDQNAKCNNTELCESSSKEGCTPVKEGSKSVANLLDEDIMVVARQVRRAFFHHKSYKILD